MKTKRTKDADTSEALRVAQAKVTKADEVAQADARQAHNAKVKFKAAKKSWKLARKQVKRSRKLAQLAEKNLAALRKHLKRFKKKSLAAKPKAEGRKVLVKKKVRRRTQPITSKALIPSAESGPPAGSESPTS